MIGDFQLHQSVLRRYYKHKEILTDPYFITIRNRFKSYCVSKNYSKVTIDHYVDQSAKFMDYLVSQGITNCKSICLYLIHNYIKTLAGYTYKTVEQNICSIRSFLRFLLEAKEIEIDLAETTPMVQARKQTRIPSIWTKDELKKLIAAIDRGSPKGKRDYAIILLACCLGIRCTDLKNLKIENFYWEKKKLVFTQSKTRMPISYIRDFLGHVDLKTTEIYARADDDTKRKAIEKVYPDLIDSNLPDWNKDQTLLSWLSELK
jgi:site-specific recombinase XerD